MNGGSQDRAAPVGNGNPDEGSFAERIEELLDDRDAKPSAGVSVPPAAADSAFRRLVEEIGVGIYVLQDGRFRFVNRSFASIFGYTPQELVRVSSFLDLVVTEDRQAFVERIEESLGGGIRAFRHEFRALRRDGERIEAEIHGTATEIDRGRALTGCLLDITDRKRALERLIEGAQNDSLTKLPSRVRFLERLQLQLAEARRHRRRFAIVSLDLDHFKFVNDKWGHATGDVVLQTLALRLQRRVRQVDTVSRFGGDEFTILMPETRHAEDASLLGAKLLDAVARPIEADGRSIQITASIGIASFPEDGDDPQSLLRAADTAMYRAKELGRGNFQLCTPEMNSRAVERLSAQSDLREALERGELFLHYQPIVSMVTGRMVGLEALIRWQHPTKGVIAPGSFISVAEETGLVLALGESALSAACHQLRRWQESGLEDLRISVNLSARQFRERDLVHLIERTLSEARVEPHCLEVEITEAVAMESAEIVVANLEALRGRGVRIAIDDFGTGYSSLGYLKQYPIHSLKIDRSFVTDVATNPADAGIVRAIVEMAHGLKLNVVAEGVENKEQFLHLQRYGCDEMQGYWVSRPLPVAEVDRLVAKELEFWTDTSQGRR